MEENQPSFVERAKVSLQDNVRWGGILVVIGYVTVGFMAVGGVLIALAGSDLTGVFSIFMALFYLLIAALYYMPIERLNRFVKGSRAALETNNEAYLIEALHGLSRAMRLLVLYTLAVIVLYGILFLGALLFGLSMNAFT
jgi:hypothetical protein